MIDGIAFFGILMVLGTLGVAGVGADGETIGFESAGFTSKSVFLFGMVCVLLGSVVLVSQGHGGQG